MRRTLAAGMISLGFLAGCGEPSPEQKCSSNMTELRSLESKINQSKIDIERGYKVHYSSQRSSYSGTCSTNVPGQRPYYYQCMKNGNITVENPVAINVQEEKRKLRLYEKSYQRLYPNSTRAYNQCLQQYR